MIKDWDKVIAEALEQLTTQEPVAWRHKVTGEFCTGGFELKAVDQWVPLYTHPKQWQGLSDEEINLLDLQHTKYKTHYDKNKNMDILIKSINCIEFSRAIENKLKEKNT
jgi:hypothetical protein